MPPRPRAKCQICDTSESKYTCSKCPVLYCSIPCYKTHKDSGCFADAGSASGARAFPPDTLPIVNAVSDTMAVPDVSSLHKPADEDAPLADSPTLRPLTSLNWPYVPEVSAYPDPLKRDDPKPLQLRQYESIATSPKVRQVLRESPRLKEVLTTIEGLRGAAREEALHRGLGVATENVRGPPVDVGDRQALRELAEAVEAAVRGGQGGLGLDWDD